MTFGEQEQVYYLNKNSTNPFSLLYVYNLPHNLTYNEVHKLVEAFGELKYVNWSPFDPLIAEVMYLNTPATQRAANALNGHRMFAGYNVLRAKVVSADAAYKVIVKNLRTECTEELLEKDFAAIVGSKVTAIIKVDPEHNIPLGYAILSFATLDAAHIVLEKGNGLCIQGNPITIEPYSQHDSPAYVHLTGLRHDATAEEIAIKFARREGAESAKRVLQYNDSKEFKVRYAEGEQTRSTLVVQFQHAEDADMESIDLKPPILLPTSTVRRIAATTSKLVPPSLQLRTKRVLLIPMRSITRLPRSIPTRMDMDLTTFRIQCPQEWRLRPPLKWCKL